MLDRINKSLADQQAKDGQFEFKTGKAQFASGNAKRNAKEITKGECKVHAVNKIGQQERERAPMAPVSLVRSFTPRPGVPWVDACPNRNVASGLSARPSVQGISSLLPERCALDTVHRVISALRRIVVVLSRGWALNAHIPAARRGAPKIQAVGMALVTGRVTGKEVRS